MILYQVEQLHSDTYNHVLYLTSYLTS